MSQSDPPDQRETVKALSRGLRLDVEIAVCALLISSLATAASWYQTRVLQEQLGAQVWPYVAINEDIVGDTMHIAVQNNGLGPAVIRNATVEVDGKRVGSLLAMMHAIVGPHVLARTPKGQRTNLSEDQNAPGSVLRPGETSVVFAFTSKRFARTLLQAYQRVNIHLCYCAIIPGKCWQNASLTAGDPQPLAACPEIKDDLLHGSATDFLNGNY